MPELPQPELRQRLRIGSVMAERERTMQARHEANPMLDSWMRAALRERFAPALREPLPEALLRLLDEAERQGAPERTR